MDRDRFLYYNYAFRVLLWLLDWRITRARYSL